MEKIVMVVVARKGSSRIPNKMFQKIGTETLIMRKVRQCIETAKIINVTAKIEVVVGTDAESIKEDVEAAGAFFYRMPDQFCQGNDPNGMIRNALSFFKSDTVLWAHPTNPFIEACDYVKAIECLQNLRSYGYDSLFSVNKLTGHFWNQHPSPLNFSLMNPVHKIATQLPPIHAQNGGIFIRPYKAMAEDGLFISGKAHMFVMDELTGWDIDYPWQLQFAQFYHKNKEFVNCL